MRRRWLWAMLVLGVSACASDGDPPAGDVDAGSGADVAGVGGEADVADAIDAEIAGGGAPDGDAQCGVDCDIDIVPGDASDGIDAADSDGLDDAGSLLPFCPGPARFVHDPLDPSRVPNLPDDFYLDAAASSPTGGLVRIDEETAPWLDAVPGDYDLVLRDLTGLDGWGTTAGVVLQFDAVLGELPSGEVDSVVSSTLQLVRLDPGTAVRVPFEVRITDAGKSAILWPMVPLEPGARHAVVATRDLASDDGGCFAPGAALASILDGTATHPRLAALVPRHAEVLAAIGVAPEDVSAMLVFTTQTLTGDSEAIAADIRARAYAWAEAPTCADTGAFIECDRAFEAWEYRDADKVLRTTEAKAPLVHVARFWLPKDVPPPWPVVVFGHGLSSDKGQGKALATRAAPEGFATIAIDAVAHGAHPAGASGQSILDVAGFFGIDVETFGLDGLVLRDNWRQSTYDKLQLLRVLEDDPDLDGDGMPDVDLDHIAYLGVSLGGIMGPELLALTDRIGAAVLPVAGGRVASIVAESETFSSLILLLAPAGATQGDIARFFPALQALIERGDASNWARHVLAKRLPGADGLVPHVLQTMAVPDSIVPNVSNVSLARALGLTHVGPVVEPVGILEEIAPPVSGNRADGAVTAGLFQYDRVTDDPGDPPEAADHDNVPASAEGIDQALHFMHTWLDSGVPEIIDPYPALGTPPLDSP